MSTKILMVMPSLPYPEHGAEQMDRAAGIRQLTRLGYEVRVVAKTNEWQTDDIVKTAAQQLGVQVIGVSNKYSNRNLTASDKLWKFLGRFRNPLYFDGAAYEYAESEIQAVVTKQADEWKPDIMWFEYTFLWPLYHIPRKRKIKIITRSANFEPTHFLEEQGRSVVNYIKYALKLVSEKRALRWSDLVFSITPREEDLYRKMGAHVVNLPLRSLPRYLNDVRNIRDRRPLNVFFMGSTYTVNHNKEALRAVIADVAPRVFSQDPNGFTFHILGKKLPKEFETYIKDNVTYAGFQDDLTVFLKDMDIALIPSLFGAGMQQKIFESLARGFPTITSERGIAAYPFVNGESVITASGTDELVKALMRLKDVRLRNSLAISARDMSRDLFTEEVIDDIVSAGISGL